MRELMNGIFDRLKRLIGSVIMSSNNVPNNKKLPFFTYGLFKPDQLAYGHINDFVDENEADSTAWSSA